MSEPPKNYLRSYNTNGNAFKSEKTGEEDNKDSLKSLKGNEGGITETEKEKYKFNVSGKNKMSFLNF